jgi:hypothetical protein
VGTGSAQARRAEKAPGVVGTKEVAVRAGVAVAFVAAVCVATAGVGPQLGGTIAAFPVMSGSLALLVHRAQGAQAAVGVLRGLVQGLGGYFAFAATVALLAPSPVAVPAGIGTCVIVAGAMVREAAPFGPRRMNLERLAGNVARWRYSVHRLSGR